VQVCGAVCGGHCVDGCSFVVALFRCKGSRGCVGVWGCTV